MPYYFNTDTEEQVWEMPSAGVSEKPSPVVEEAVTLPYDESAAPIVEENAAPVTEEAAPIEMETEPPTELTEPTTESTEIEKETQVLPTGWVEYKDEDQHQYYYNTIDGSQVWEFPTESAEAAAAAAAAAAETTTEGTVREEEPAEDLGNDATETLELPAGWVQYMDEESGTPYYFNTETEEQVWEMPSQSGMETAAAAEETLPEYVIES